MPHLVNPPPHIYASGDFDRATKRRIDAAWLARQRADPATRVLLMSKLELLITDGGAPPCAMRPVRSALPSVRTSASWPISSDRRCGRWRRASTR